MKLYPKQTDRISHCVLGARISRKGASMLGKLTVPLKKNPWGFSLVLQNEGTDGNKV